MVLLTDQLTHKQQRYVEELLQDPDRGQRAAAIRAGYSPKSAHVMSTILMKNPKIIEAIERGEAVTAKQMGITPERILLELMKLGLSNPKDLADLIEDGKSLKDLPDEVTASLREITIDTTEFRGQQTKKVKAATYDKLKALELLGKHIGMFKDKVEVQGALTLQSLVEDSFKKEPETVETSE